MRLLMTHTDLADVLRQGFGCEGVAFALVTTKAAVELRAFNCAIRAVASLLSFWRCRTRRSREMVSAAVAAAAQRRAAESCRLAIDYVHGLSSPIY